MADCRLMQIWPKDSASSTRGFALPMSMAVLSVSGLMIYGMMQMSQNRLVAKRISELSQKQQMLVDSSRQSISNGSTLYTSAIQPGNAALDRCVRGVGGATCNDNVERQFEAYAPIGSGGAAVKLSGSAGSRVAYDLDGQICTSGTPPALSTVCPFYLETFFRAQCTNGAAICNAGAYAVELRSQLVHSASFPLPSPYGGKVFGVLPADTSLFLSSITVAEIMADIHQGCNPNSNVIGYTNTGVIKCQCLPNFTQSSIDPNNGLPVCTAANQSCPTNQYFLGIDATGGPICEPPDYSTVPCWTVFGRSGVPFDCGADDRSRVRSLKNFNSNCEAGLFSMPTADGDYPGYARCNNIEARCCSAS